MVVASVSVEVYAAPSTDYSHSGFNVRRRVVNPRLTWSVALFLT
jgi:hypothetical protein